MKLTKTSLCIIAIFAIVVHFFFRHQSIQNKEVISESKQLAYPISPIETFEKDIPNELTLHIEDVSQMTKEQALLREETNEFLTNTVDSIYEIYEEEKKNLIESLDSQNSTEDNKWFDTFYLTDIASDHYSSGIELVRNEGHEQTAEYMEYGFVSSDYVPESYSLKPNSHHNDEWSHEVVSEEKFQEHIHQKIVQSNNDYGVVNGTYSFLEGNFMTALHNVSYSVSYVKTDDGTFDKSILILDVFDFDWEIDWYDDFKLGLGNNYAAVMERLGLIQPFMIIISYKE